FVLCRILSLLYIFSLGCLSASCSPYIHTFPTRRSSDLCLTAMYDTRALGKRYFQKCGHEDYALWLSIAKEGYTVYGLPDALAFYRISSGSVSSNKVKVLKFFWNIYRNIEGFSAARSLFMCLRYAWNARSKYKTGT